MVDDRDRDVLALLARMLEHAEAHVIFNALPPRDDRGELAFRIIHRQHQHLARGLRAGADHDVPVVERHADAGPEPLVALLVHIHVGFDRRADLVPADQVRPLRVVEHRVEHIPGVGREARGGDAVEALRQLLAGVEVADRKIIAFVAARVDAEEHPAAVLADIHAAEREELVPLRLHVRVEDDLLPRELARRLCGVDHRRVPVVRAADRQAALCTVLQPLLRAHVIPIAVHARWHRHVGLLHARLELVEQPLAQRFEMGHARVRVCVLLLHEPLQLRRFLVAHPLVRVDEHVVVECAGGGRAPGARRLWCVLFVGHAPIIGTPHGMRRAPI